MLAYDPNDNSHVAVIIHWWSSLTADERNLIFHPDLQVLSTFLRHFNDGEAHLMFNADQRGIWIAAWTSPMFDAALFSCWVRPDKRRYKSSWKELASAYTAALSVYPTLVGITRQPHLHAEHLKMGYAYSGCLKNVLTSGPVWVYELTRERWQNRIAAAREVREAKRNGRLSRRQQVIVKQLDGDDHLAVRGNVGESGQEPDGSGGAIAADDGGTDARSIEDWRRQFFHSVDNESA